MDAALVSRGVNHVHVVITFTLYGYVLLTTYGKTTAAVHESLFEIV